MGPAELAGPRLEAYALSEALMIDIGANLANKAFHADFDAVIERAVASGVTRMIVTGTSESESQAAHALAKQHPDLLSSTAGVHPHDAKSVTDLNLPILRELAAHPGVVAIGECGLDYNRDFSPRDVQREVFAAQVGLACELQLPLFLHERDAHEDFLRILTEPADRLPPAVVHCFTGERDALMAYIEAGTYIGITGWICDERRGEHLRELVKLIPSDRLLVETDCPYLAPRNMRPKAPKGRNEPAFLGHIVQDVAGCLGVDVEALAAQTTANAERFFQL